MTQAKKSGRKNHGWIFAGIMMAALLAGGCASRRDRMEDVFAPALPAYFSPAINLLLSNEISFSARMNVEITGAGANGKKAKPVSGLLVGQGAQFFFQPTGKTDRSYIWNAAENHGYILSEALQGYAPFSPLVKPAGSGVEGASTAQAASMNGHPCRVVGQVVLLSDGSDLKFTVWRATDLNEFPVRIQSGTANPPFIIDITEIKKEPVTAGLFQPPKDFSKYTSPEIMMTELVSRKAKQRRAVINEDNEISEGRDCEDHSKGA